MAPLPQDQATGIQARQEGVQEYQGPAPAAPPPADVAVRPRVWPGVLIAALTSAIVLVPPFVSDNPMVRGMSKFIGPMVGALLLLLWWLAASRVSWGDKLAVAALFLLAGGMGILVIHRSFIPGLIMYGLWAAVVAWPVWLLASTPMAWPTRRLGLVAVLFAVFGACGLFRIGGFDGNFEPEVGWRFSPTSEEQYLAGRTGAGGGKPAATLEAKPGDWVGFRGEGADGVARGVKVARTDWSEKAPGQVWRRRVGPGWSSFAVVGGYLFTQEQQGEEEAVVCLDAATGEEVWAAPVGKRFDELVSGAGPRATPTFHKGQLFAFGANGLLVCLDAATGKEVWKADVVKDTGAGVPTWGFASSPCIAGGLVSVYIGLIKGKGTAVAAYDAKTGEKKWTGGQGGHGYASVQHVTLAGVPLLMVASGTGLIGLDPATGATRLDYPWPMEDTMARCVQTAVLGPDEVLLGTGFGQGARRLKVKKEGDTLTASEVWTTTRLNSYFTDVVVHDGHAYGCDGEFLTCVDLADGATKWRRRGFQNGQVLLLPEQGLVLVQAEKSGDVALIEATPKEYTQKGKFKAIKGKTWNHPVIAHGRLYIRNGEEMACYDVSK